MRILQLHNHHRTKGGAMEVLAREAELLAGAGHRVEQYTVGPPEEAGLSGLRAGAKAVWNVQATREVDALIQRFRPDVAHVHTPFPLLSPAVFRTTSRSGVPAVATLHSYRYSCIAATCYRDGHICEDCLGKRVKYPGVLHRCYHDSLAASGALTLSLTLHRRIGTFHHHVDRFLALTDFSKRLLERDGIPAHKIAVKPNFVPDPGEPTRQSAGSYVAFVGRLIDVKGVRTILDAWPHARHVGRKLLIAGDGELRPLVDARAREDPTIEPVGWVDQDAVTRLMADASCVVVPSLWYEGHPLVVLQSLSVGTPVLVSNLENNSAELLTDDVGAAFDVGDPNSLAAELVNLLSNRARLSVLRTNARASYLVRYSPPANLRMLERIYGDVTGLSLAGREDA